MALTLIRCPRCRTIIDFKPGPAWEQDEIKAPEIFKCNKCGGLISTENSEWTDKPSGEKLVYKFKILGWIVSAILLGFAVAMMATLLLTVWIKIVDVNNRRKLAIPLFIIFSSLFVYLTIRIIKTEIRESLERTTKRSRF